MKQLLNKLLNGIIYVFYLMIGIFIVSLLFVGDDIPIWQKILVFIGGCVLLFLLNLLSGFINKKTM